ncbi:MAG: FMN-binding protein [Agitococcus sp.]|nr:FMN-binding protein [Agitococcus sp.]
MLRFLYVLFGFMLTSYSFANSPLDDFLQKKLLQPVEPKILWLNQTLKKRAETILDHPYQGLRVRYWQSGSRTAWVLDEIGKEQPITTGIIVENGKILSVDVLVYRESRGAEVQQSFFTRQFQGVSLTSNDKLSKKIDGITGATLSVWALQKVARLALMFDAEKEHVNKP